MKNSEILMSPLIKVSTVLCFLLMANCICANAQISKRQPSNDNPGLSIGVEIGAAGNFASGGGISEQINEFKTSGDENDTFTGKKYVLVRPLFTVLVDYPVNETLFIRGGIRFTKRGYSMKLDALYRDNEYQLDQQYQYTEKYGVAVFELPFSVVYKLNDVISLTPGFLVGVPLKSSGKLNIAISQKTITNGKETDSESTAEDVNASENSHSGYYGISLGAEYKIYSNVYAGLSVQRIMNYAQFTNNNLSDNSITISIKYLLPLHKLLNLKL